MPGGNADIITTLRVDGDEIDGKLTGPAQEAQEALEGMTDQARTANPALLALSEATGGFAEGLEDIPILGSFIGRLGVAGTAASVGIGLAVAAVTALVKISDRAREVVREIATEADNLGLSTDGFQVLRLEAAEANLEFGSLSSGLQNYQNQLAQLSQGSGELSSRLAPATAETLQAATTFEGQIDAISAALSNARSETEFLNIATAAFGESGIEVGRFLRDNVGTLGELEESYSSFNGVISESQIRAIEGNARVVDALTAQSSALGDQIAANLEPVGSAIRIGILFQINKVLSGFAELTAPGRNSPRRALQDLEADVDTTTASVARLRAEIEQTTDFVAGETLKFDLSLAEAQLESLEAALATARSNVSGGSTLSSGSDLDFVTPFTPPPADTESIELVNALLEDTLSLEEQRLAAIAEYEAAVRAGVVVTEAQDAAIRAVINSQFEDTAAKREAIAAENEKRRAVAESIRLDRQAASVLSDLGDTSLAVAQKRAELTQLIGDGRLTQENVNDAVAAYEARLTGADRAQRELFAALERTQTLQQTYAADIASLEAAQSQANIPAEQFNAILAARSQLYQDQVAAQEEAQQREDFGGETLEEAQERIRESLLTATEIIDERLALERRIVEALVQEGALSDDQAAARLAAYREELEKAANETDRLSDSQRNLTDLISAAGDGWDALGDVALRVLEDILIQQLNVQNAGGAGGFGGFLSSLGGAIGSAFGFGGGSTTVPVNHSGTASVGSSTGVTRSVDAAIFNNAPRFHAGIAELGSDEVASILQRGERVTTASDSRALVNAINAATAMSAAAANDRGFSAGGLDVTIINNGNNSVTAEERQSDDGRRELLIQINELVERGTLQTLASPRGQKVMRDTFALRPRLGQR